MNDGSPYDISDEDWRAALREMKAYIDITEQDLKAIYQIALKHARERLALATPVAEIMTREVITIGREADLHQAAVLLAEHAFSGLPVVDAEQRVLGVVTEADILATLCLHEEHSFRNTLKHLIGERPERRSGETVAAVMSAPAITARPDEDVRDAARILTEQHITRLPVVDEQNRLLGIVSRGDIIKAINRSAR